MPKIFGESGIKAKGNVLPLKDFVLFREVKKQTFNERYAMELVKSAEEYLEADMPMLKLSVFRQFQLNGNRSNYQSPYFKRREMALVLALAEYYERQGRFTERLCDLIWAIMEESTWIIPAHTSVNPVCGPFDVPPIFGDNALHGIDLYVATTCATLAFIYHYCKDIIEEVSPVITAKLLYMIHDRGIKPFLYCTFGWSGELGNKPNNWCPWIVSNILAAMAVTAEDLSIRERVTDKAMKMLDCFTRDYNNDGGCDEGPAYWGAAGASYFDALETLYDISGGAIDVYSHPLVKAMGEYIVKFNINGKRFVNFADCGPSTCHDGCMIRRYGEKTGSEIMPPFGDMMNSFGAKHYVSHSHVYRAMRNLITPDRDSASPKAATRVWFPDLKVMTARESEDPSLGLFVAMKGGHNSESHNHNDVGNVVVYYNGNPVIIDTGVGTYTKKTFSPQRYELWYMQSSYHNLPDINGVAQRNGPQYRSKDETYDESCGALQLELKDAYLPEACINSYVRKTELKGQSVVISETISLENEGEVTFHIMSHTEPRLIEDGAIELAEGRILYYDTRLGYRAEEFEALDGGIEKNWGRKTLYRLHFTARLTSDKFIFTIK